MFHSSILSSKREYFQTHFATCKEDTPLVVQVLFFFKNDNNSSCVVTIRRNLWKQVGWFCPTARMLIWISVVLRELLERGDMELFFYRIMTKSKRLCVNCEWRRFPIPSRFAFFPTFHPPFVYVSCFKGREYRLLQSMVDSKKRSESLQDHVIGKPFVRSYQIAVFLLLPMVVLIVWRALNDASKKQAFLL